MNTSELPADNQQGKKLLDVQQYVETAPPESVARRLLGPLIVDEQREAQYRNLQAALLRKTEVGRRLWLAQLLTAFSADRSVITFQDLEGVELVADDPYVQYLGAEHDYPFARVYFKFNLKQYHYIYQKLGGRGNSNGCTISGGALEANPLTRGIGVILAPGMTPEITHELEHTIDPHHRRRKPEDEVLSEVAVFYRERFIPTTVTTTTRQYDSQGKPLEPVTTVAERYKPLGYLRQTLLSPTYVEQYRRNFATPEEYQFIVNKIFNTLEELEKKLEPIDLGRAIYNAGSVAELLQLNLELKTKKE